MFTAFEISLALKDQGVRERHRNLKSTIHDVLARVAGGNYSRTLMDVGAPSQAWVYHKLRDNPYLYEPLDRSGFEDPAKKKSARPQPQVAPRDPKPLRAGGAEPPTNNDGVFGMDAQGNLTIPQSLIVRLGLAPGDEVHLVCDKLNQQIRLRRPSQLNLEPHQASETVAQDGKVTLKLELLKTVELDGLQCYQVLSGGNQITVGTFPED
jgi:hypothetical protein